MTRPEKRFLGQIDAEIKRYDRSIDRKRFPQALESHEKLVAGLKTIQNENLTAPFRMELESRLASMEELRKKLIDGGEKPSEIPEFTEGDSPSSFESVARILNSRCGNCHVRQARGQFSMATARSLADSGHLVPGDPVQSRIVQVMETGEMPPNGNRVPDEEVQKIRQWISAGAQTSGNDDVNLGRIGQGEGGAMNSVPAANLVRATGNETVSFSRDIAPVLVESCRGCHVDSNRPRGGLNLNTIETLLRGGDSGGALVSGNGADSLLVKKLRGTADGQRMPQGRGPLGEEVIKKFETWIDEGATFDGNSPTTPVRTLAAVAATSAMNDKQLEESRTEQAVSSWQLAFPGTKPSIVTAGDYRIVGDATGAVQQVWTRQMDEIAGSVRETLGMEPGQLLVRGKATLFYLRRTYDYAEFSRMKTGRAQEADSLTFWVYDVVDAFVAARYVEGAESAELEFALCQKLGALSIAATANDVPRWFSESMGYVIAEKSLPKNPVVRKVQLQAEQASKGLKSPADIRNSGTREETAALAGYYALGQIFRNNPRWLRDLRNNLQSGENFEVAIQNTFGASIEQLFPANSGQ